MLFGKLFSFVRSSVFSDIMSVFIYLSDAHNYYVRYSPQWVVHTFYIVRSATWRIVKDAEDQQ